MVNGFVHEVLHTLRTISVCFFSFEICFLSAVHGSKLCLESILCSLEMRFLVCDVFVLTESCGSSMGFMKAVALGSCLCSLYQVCKSLVRFFFFFFFLKPMMMMPRNGEDSQVVQGFYIKAERALVPRAPGL